MTTKREPCLIPVRLNACVLDPRTLPRTKEVTTLGGTTRPSSHSWAWHSPSYEKLDASRNDALERIWPRLFDPTTPPTMENRGGICLTISLPEGFSKPLQETPSSIPRLPDRWLWVRILRPLHALDGTQINEIPQTKTWIVDAGVITDNPESPPVLTNENGRMRARRIGVRRTLQEASPIRPDEPRIKLHHQGTDQSASLTFATYSPMNLNNMSYIDPLDDVSPEDLSRSALSYFVIGWYREFDLDDPLHILRSADASDVDISRILQFDEQSPGNTSLGDRCIFHGLVAHIDYWNPHSYLGPAFGSPSSDPVFPCLGTRQELPQKIGFGMTPEDALASLAADISPDDAANQKLSADFFQLLRMMLLDQLEAGDSLCTDEILRTAERNATFQRAAGTFEWTIGAATSPAFEAQQVPQFEISFEQRSILQSLNEIQTQRDAAQSKFCGAAESLYTAWWQALRARGRRKLALDEAVKQRCEIVQKLQDDGQRLQKSVDSIRIALQVSLDATHGANVLEVRMVATDQYHVPKEPAIAIRNIGPKLPPFSKVTLPRTANQIVNSPVPNSYFQFERANIRAQLLDYKDPELLPLLQSLADEASIAEAAIAGLIRTSGPSNGFTAMSHVEQWQDRNRLVRIREGELSFLTASNETVVSKRLGMAWAEQPWIPLFLDWEVEWFANADMMASSTGTPLQGRTILVSRPQTMIHAQMSRLEKMASRMAPVLADCRHLFDDVMQWDILAQTLSGLHQQLLLRDDSLPRLMPADEPLRPLVAGTTLAPPNLAPNLEFSALRQGHIRIGRLWVVDAFGQAFSLNPTIKTSISARSTEFLPLPTRILEPARLKVDIQKDPVTNHPVRAWFLPIFADKSLVVYNPEGHPLGLITHRLALDNTPETIWQPANRSAPSHPSELPDPILSTFLSPLVGDSEARLRFDTLLRHIDEALARTLPAQSNANRSLAAMLGRPLVLLQADVCVDRFGGSIESPDDIANGRSGFPPQSPITAPAWVGMRNRLDDGVIGYQIAQPTLPLRRTAKLEFGPPRDAPAFQLDLSRNPKSVSLFLLADPQGVIYLESEILPLTTLRLPPAWVNEMVEKLPAVMRLSPILLQSHSQLRSIFDPSATSTQNIDLPLPMSKNGESSAETSAIFSTNGGRDIPVQPTSAKNGFPETSVAAIEGILIV